MNKKLSKYSQTLYNISAENNNINMIQNELNTIVHLYKKVPSFRFIIITKRVTSDKKINILKNTLQNFNPLVTEFISLIITNGHAKNLLTIISNIINKQNFTDAHTCYKVFHRDIFNTINLEVCIFSYQLPGSVTLPIERLSSSNKILGCEWFIYFNVSSFSKSACDG